ncbi:MAG: sensor histidine kinase [Terriglobia bacterium]
MKGRISISVKILLLSFLNVFLLLLVFAVFVRIQYRLDLGSLLLSPGRDRILALSRLIALQLPDTDRKDWDRLLAGYTPTTRASACLYNLQGEQLAGPPVTLPAEVLENVRRDPRHDHGPHGGPPGMGPAEGNGPSKGESGPPDVHAAPPPGRSWQPAPERVPAPPPFPVFMVRIGPPTRYWVGVHVPVFDRSTMKAEETTLVWTFSSLWTNPFFFDYTPWLAAAIVVILVSVACWLPLIRGLTHSISQLTAATGAIAEGKLETRLTLRRRDELGQLSEAINRMAERLAGFVHGQRRFLSDIAHELCSPIARIQVSLGILDQRAQPNQKEYVEGVQEEMEHMSGLVNELLLFSRAQLHNTTTPLTRVNVAETVRRVLDREGGGGARIETQVDEHAEVMAYPEYLFRALANLVRNAVRYAGDCGPIVISAQEKGRTILIFVADQGPGIPEAEIEAVFKPFYRPEYARQRETGGVGLGLAIVRTCIEACGGTVQCHNRSPKGLEVEIKLPTAEG